MSLPLSGSTSAQYVLFYWNFLAITSSFINAILVLILVQNFRSDASFVSWFIATTVLVPVCLSIGSTLYLSRIGEKRVLRVWNIQVLSLGVVIIVEYVMISYLPTFFGIALLLFLYMLGVGFILDVVTLPILGISGGRSECIPFLLISDSNTTKMKTLLSPDGIVEALETLPLEEVSDYHVLRSRERIGFNWFLFLFEHPVEQSRSVLVSIGYDRRQFEIRGTRLTRHRLRGKMAHLSTLLSGEASLDSSCALDSFIQSYPNFEYLAEKAYEYALRPTEIPLRRIEGLSNTAKAILITIIGTVLVSLLLLTEGFITQGQFLLSLVPEMALIGAELLSLIPQQRRRP